MGKLSRADLAAIKEKLDREDPLRTGIKRTRITVHKGTCGIAAGAEKIYETIEKQAALNNVRDLVVTTSGCMGICCREPLITVEERDKDAVVYELLTSEKTERICTTKNQPQMDIDSCR